MLNAISILIDSVTWDFIGNNRYKVSPTPFLDSLRNESLVASNLYSQGPYTDAATKSIYTGRNCLNDFGYFFKLNSAPSNHYKVFKDNGYETYGFYYPYYMIGPEIKKYVDHSYYTSRFLFESEWYGIYSYYSELLKERKLNQMEISLLIDRTSLLFNVWIDFYQDICDKPKSSFLIQKGVSRVDILSKLELLKKQKQKYIRNKLDFIYDLLKSGDTHFFFRLDDIDVDAYIDKDFLSEDIYRDYKSTFKKIKWNTIKANIIKNCPSMLRIIRAIKSYTQTKNKQDFLFLLNYWLCLKYPGLSIKKSKLPNWQNLPSAKRILTGAFSVIEQMDRKKPFYMSLHLLDPHHDISFFSYDIQDKQQLQEEFDVLNNYINKLGTDFKGNLNYILSIRYVDYCIEKFCLNLKNNGLWDNSSLLIFADHGSSFGFSPLHNNNVNCFDDECYHVPMMIRIPNAKHLTFTDYHNTIDIYPTFFFALGINTPLEFDGKPMFENNNNKNYIMTEYMGPGCPDLLSRRIWFSIRDEKYVIGYKVGIYEEFKCGELAVVFNLSKDPTAIYNIAYKIDLTEIDYLLSIIRIRYEEIKKDTHNFISNLIN